MRKRTDHASLCLPRYDGILFVYGICALVVLLTAVAAIGDAPEPRQAAYEAVARAEALDAEDNWQGAVQILRGVVSRYPYRWPSNNSTGGYQGQGYRLLGEILTRERPNWGEGCVYLGIDRVQEHPGEDGYGQAEQTFRQGLAVDPDNPVLQFAVGWAILRQDKAGDCFQKKPETLRCALEFFEKAADLAPGFRQANVSAGYAYLHLAYLINGPEGYQPESRPFLEKSAFYLERMARSRNPGWGVHRDLAHIYDSLGQHERAAVHRLSMFVVQVRNGEGKVYFPRGQWVAGGKAFVFPLIIHSPAYDIPRSLYVIEADGRNLRTVWKGNFTRFLVSPDGTRALLWVLDERWSDCPEPRRMAGVNLLTGRRKWFKDGMVALEPGAVTDGRYRQSIKWSKDARSVTLLVCLQPDRSNWRRETLTLP